MIVVAPSKLAIASQTPIVPLAKLLISNTPIGPFQTTVFAPCNVSANNFTDAGPMSKAIKPSGMSPSITCVSTSFENSGAQTLSIGKTSLSPAFSINSFASSTLSASTRELPILIPFAS